jgi:hypothetical protein
VSDLDGNNTLVCLWYGSNISGPWTKAQQNNSIVANTTVKDLNSSYSSGWNTQYWWKVTANDGHTNSSVIYTFTTRAMLVNNPPYVPSQPNPANGATNVLLNAILSWIGGDPDGDPVTYDVYFGTTSSPPKVKSNQSALSYSPGTLSYNTIYYWKIVAWDNHSASAKGLLWSFTTKQLPPMKVIITKPLENTLYIQDKEIMSIPINTIIYGRINITADVTSEISIARVEFYVDGKLKVTDTALPYIYLWNPLISFNGTSLKHTIKVVAYDNLGNHASAELNVTKWRFHALPFIAAGAAIASRLLLHTTVRGLFLNLQESRISVSFYAIRAQYITKGPFRYARGAVNFKSCTGGIPIGPIKMTQIGPFYKLTYGTFTFLGEINYNSGGFGQGFIRQLIQSKTHTSLRDILQSLKS